MKNTTKRTLSFVLIVCMLLSVLPFGAFAADTLTYTYSFSQWTANQNGITVDVGTIAPDGTWQYVAKSTDDKKADGKPTDLNLKTTVDVNAEKNFTRFKWQSPTSFVAFKLTGITAGTYTMDVGVHGGSAGASANIYVIPTAEFPAECADIQAKLAAMTPAGKVGCYSKSGVVDSASISNVTFSGSADNSYVVVFRATDPNPNYIELNPEKSLRDTTFNLKSITLSGTAAGAPGGEGEGEGSGDAGYTPETKNQSWTAVEYFAATKALVEGSEDLVQIQIPYGNFNTGFATKYADSTNSSYAGAGNEYLAYTINNNANTAGQSFVNTKFNTVGAGTYTVTFDVKNWGATTTLSVHVFSEEDFAGITNSSGRNTKTAELIAAGAHKVHTVETTSKTDTDLIFTADLPEAPIICLAGPATDGVKNAIQFTKVSFTLSTGNEAPEPVDPNNFAEVTVNGSTTKCTTEAEAVAAITGAANGTVIKLMNNINVGDSAVLPEGVTIDLNGRALSGTIDTTQGTIIDSKDGKGSISVKPAKIADGKIVLKDGSNYRIFGYSVKVVEAAKANADKSGAFFWYRVSFSNKSAYALAKADADFSIGAKLTVGDKSATVKFDDALIDAWTAASAKYFVVCLEGLNSDAIAAGTVLTLTPVVNGVENSASISYTK